MARVAEQLPLAAHSQHTCRSCARCAAAHEVADGTIMLLPCYYIRDIYPPKGANRGSRAPLNQRN
jgi:hypothetical protein